ncbi:MAG: nuoJ [Phycisphaerales bacterium]|jgi:NADH-quinone oxidoreductase subunit J|nr:nuoJ [Phycisphaerales bacterium]MDB5305361.1 nuoJ [Phycisphaerales bacterium]
MITCLAQTASPDAGFIATALFYLFALMAGGSAIGVVVTRNVVRMAVMLMFTLIGVAGLYFLLGAEFLAAVQLVIYAGGTLILIVFGVMLTTKSPFARFEPKLAEVVVAVTVGVVLFAALILAISPANVTFASSPIPAGQEYPMARLGQALLGDYVVPFELISVLLLVVMIGAAYLAKARKRKE